jgi:hypothetical protein
VTSGEDLIDANAVADDVNQYCKPAIHDALEEFNATWREFEREQYTYHLGNTGNEVVARIIDIIEKAQRQEARLRKLIARGRQ